MSVHISSNVWKSSFDTPLQKLILLAFADMANDEGYCWPSVRSIKERVGVADSTIRENVRALEAMGWLRRESRSTDRGQASNGYWVSKTPPSATPSPLNHQGTSIEPQDSPGMDSDPEPFTPELIREAWNEECRSLPHIATITASRYKHAKARCGGNINYLREVFRRVEASDFVSGRSRGVSAWASFDWVVKPDNWAKIIEGRYDNRNGAKGNIAVDDKTPVGHGAF